VQSVSGNNTFAGPIQINATGTSRIGSQDGASLTLSGPITMSGATGVTVLFRVGNTDGDFVTLTNSGNSWDTQSHIFSNNAAAGAGVRLGVVNALPTAAPLVGFGGAGIGTTLDLASFSQEVAGLSNTGANSNLRITNSIAASNSVLTLTNAANLNSGANVVIADGAGVVSLVKAGTFSQTLAAANSFSGDIIVNNGTLIGAGATNSPGISVFGSRLNTRTINVNSGGTLQFNSGNILGANHVSTDSPTLVINSGGIVTNGGTATNNALNNVQLNDGTLTSTTGHTGSSAPNLPVYGAWNLNGSVISTGNSTISTTDPTKGWIMLKVVGDKTTDFSVTSGTLTVSAPVVDNPTDNNTGSLNKSGAGAMVLSAANTYTGNTTVSAGTFELADNAQLKFVLGSTSGVANSISGAGTVTLNGDFVIDTSAADGLTSGSWALENVAALTGAYGSSFTVVGFTDAGADKWTKVNGTKTYTFDETTGILTLASPAGYSSWASTNAIGSTPGQDKDGDGVSNAIEYVLGGNVSSNDLSKLPQSSISGSNLVFTFQRNVDSIDGSTLLRIQVGTTLSEWSAVYNVGANTAGSSAGVTVIEDSSPGFDTITLTVPMGSDQKKFARLNVEVTP
jgi:autotransporter-associated beta strand protein